MGPQGLLMVPRSEVMEGQTGFRCQKGQDSVGTLNGRDCLEGKRPTLVEQGSLCLGGACRSPWDGTSAVVYTEHLSVLPGNQIRIFSVL